MPSVTSIIKGLTVMVSLTLLTLPAHAGQIGKTVAGAESTQAVSQFGSTIKDSNIEQLDMMMCITEYDGSCDKVTEHGLDPEAIKHDDNALNALLVKQNAAILQAPKTLNDDLGDNLETIAAPPGYGVAKKVFSKNE